MDKINLVLPSESYEKQAKEYLQEHFENGENILNGDGGLDHSENFDEWLNDVYEEHNEINIQEGRVGASTYFAVRESDNRIIGMINIRHSLNDRLLMHGGHIGYGVRPSERKKGYATRILELGLEKCMELGIDKVLVTCDKSNIGSAKTIEKSNGKLENEVIDADGEPILRYWIDIKLRRLQVEKKDSIDFDTIL